MRSASRAVALTGAGISTPSGIPDFRSPGSGLWSRYNPMQVASLTAFRYNPDKFYAWFHELAAMIWNALPNPAHHALADLERAGFLAGVVTQNVDGLHQAAGSGTVIEVHGHLRQATCIRCHRSEPSTAHFARFVETGEVPRCPECQGHLKPDVVLYGEQLPYAMLQKAHALFSTADLVLVGGSSLEVTPAAQFPLPSLNRGARLLIVNREPTYLDERAEAVFRNDIAQVLPQLAAEVLDG